MSYCDNKGAEYVSLVFLLFISALLLFWSFWYILPIIHLFCGWRLNYWFFWNIVTFC